ncbi:MULTISPECIES: S41 family peptidase [unclassified Nocardioides]|uniref:S41 family peptidase n=1 Tax=unclassified Nocardioides TaxID=2615069 RepID=UPI0036108A51
MITRVQDHVRTHYVFADVADQIADALDDLHLDEDPATAAAQLTKMLQSVNRDLHLRVRHYPDGVPPEDDEVSVQAWFADQARRHGAGIAEVRRLEDNTGLIVLGPIILTPDHLTPAAAAAFTLLSGIRRMVLDLRGCVGGVPESVALLVSHFTGEEPVHLQDLVERDGTVTPSWTTPDVSPKVPADVPVDVLTSPRTFSGGEELTYDLQSLRRARVVGETTGGGAHPRKAFDLTPHLQLHIPTARSVNAVTGTNWEGTGVVPDLPCPADQALEVALQR